MSGMGRRPPLPFAGRHATVVIMRAISIIATSIALTSAAVGGQSVPLKGAEVCAARETGDTERYLVGSEKTAKAIFLAVERDYAPWADKTNYPDVYVRNEGSYWSVFRMRSAKRDHAKDGEIIVSAGGGQLSIHIDKCNGGISSVYLSR